MTYNGIQSKIKTIGENGCYWLAILAQCKFDGDILKYYDKCVAHKWIAEDCTVLHPNIIAQDLDPKYRSFTVTKSEEPSKDAYFSIQVWKNGAYTHFKLPDIDTLKNSNTVKNGKLVEYRHFFLK